MLTVRRAKRLQRALALGLVYGQFMSLSGMVEIPRPFDWAQDMLQAQ